MLRIGKFDSLCTNGMSAQHNHCTAGCNAYMCMHAPTLASTECQSWPTDRSSTPSWVAFILDLATMYPSWPCMPCSRADLHAMITV